MKNKTSNRRLIFQLAAVVVLIVIAYAMTIIGRGHTVYLDNKEVRVQRKDLRHAVQGRRRLWTASRSPSSMTAKRGSATCIGQKFTVTLEITEKKGRQRDDADLHDPPA